jgi:hypothetical protein
MEGFSQSTVLNAPKPTSPFEAYMIQFATQTTRSIEDLAESIAFVANVTVTKEEFEERMAGVATKDDLAKCATKDDLAQCATKDDLKTFATKEDLKNLATKLDLGAVEHRIKSYIDDKVVAQNVMPIIQNQDKKLNLVIDTLKKNSTISAAESDYLKKQGSFPHLA